MNPTERDLVEKILLANFSDELKPLKQTDIKVLNEFKDGSFGFSYLGIMLYANGCNEKGKSTEHPQGLIYYDGDTIFGVGFFKKDLEEDVGHLHIVAPKGGNWLKTVNKFIEKSRTLSPLFQNSVYIRHLHDQQYQELINDGYQSIDSDPWHLVAPSEDETFNHRFIKIDDIVDCSNDGIVVKCLSTNDSKNFRRKAKMAYNRFANFLERNNLNYQIEVYNPAQHAELAKKMVIEHFRTLKNAVGSTPQDYFNLINFMPEDLGNDLTGYIGFLIGNGEKIPVALFIGEKIGTDTMALYATFALRNEPCISEKFDPTGYTAISQYSYIRIFELLSKRGYKYADLGGSEVEDLNDFKRQLGANEKMTYWAVKV